MKKCMKCGKEIDETITNFCPNCGQIIAESELAKVRVFRVYEYMKLICAIALLIIPFSMPCFSGVITNIRYSDWSFITALDFAINNSLLSSETMVFTLLPLALYLASKLGLLFSSLLNKKFFNQDNIMLKIDYIVSLVLASVYGYFFVFGSSLIFKHYNNLIETGLFYYLYALLSATFIWINCTKPKFEQKERSINLKKGIR